MVPRPRVSFSTGLGQGDRFTPLPLAAPAACRPWMFRHGPWIWPPSLGEHLGPHTEGLSSAREVLLQERTKRRCAPRSIRIASASLNSVRLPSNGDDKGIIRQVWEV